MIDLSSASVAWWVCFYFSLLLHEPSVDNCLLPLLLLLLIMMMMSWLTNLLLLLLLRLLLVRCQRIELEVSRLLTVVCLFIWPLYLSCTYTFSFSAHTKTKSVSPTLAYAKLFTLSLSLSLFCAHLHIKRTKQSSATLSSSLCVQSDCIIMTQQEKFSLKLAEVCVCV